ncbi:MAG: hypothetical protein K2J27_09420 [Duncaniella sp.]|nr:hypothetical protein [Duncaniella sp.]
MTPIEFLQLISALRTNSGLDCVGPLYYVFIRKDMKSAVVNRVGYTDMSQIAYIIVVTAHRWTNLGYTNTSLITLGMFDANYNPVETIPFGEWQMDKLNFIQFYGSYYDCYRPYPQLSLVSDPEINTYSAIEEDKTIYFSFPQYSIEQFTDILTSIHKFIAAYKAGKTITWKEYEEKGLELLY